MMTIMQRVDPHLSVAIVVSLLFHAALIVAAVFAWDASPPKVITSIKVGLNALVVTPPEQPTVTPKTAVFATEPVIQTAPETVREVAVPKPTPRPTEPQIVRRSATTAYITGDAIRSFIGTTEIHAPPTFSSESGLAEHYRRQWHQRVQRIGQLNYPAAASHLKLSGQLTLRVAINTDGSLASVGVLQSSGYDELDFAALNIVRQAAPFNPLPPNLPRTNSQFRFESTWEFRR